MTIFLEKLLNSTSRMMISASSIVLDFISRFNSILLLNLSRISLSFGILLLFFSFSSSIFVLVESLRIIFSPVNLLNFHHE